ncbi:CRISPR-associated Cas4 family exonuclease [Hydrogenivirga caldilitoris]|uniref:CRISPR-associated exonuclease Cas4 n=1 Tax=Hydrogenivirga caldilitoris TaxID=246264 RepID=A0A497XPA0_9AQUI|nr:CRISPR-associated protein Cas4 [Hydrogenivirga caldilitoris]RLJ70698.1 CRISPR-associated Cas4 family exonuclease [Hydrogenivirga caldilitoris]
MTVISSEELKEIKFKGTQVAYAVVCPRKLWLFSRGIALEHSSDRVALGKFVDEVSFRGKEGFSDENVSIDFITIDDELVVHEIKLSSSLEEAHEVQIKYYIYYLRLKGARVSYGLLHYPRLRKIKRVEFGKEDEAKIEEILARLEKTLELPEPPPVINAPYCKKCAYYELCYG